MGSLGFPLLLFCFGVFCISPFCTDHVPKAALSFMPNAQFLCHSAFICKNKIYKCMVFIVKKSGKQKRKWCRFADSHALSAQWNSTNKIEILKRTSKSSLI